MSETKIGYFISVVKQTSMTGESVQINCNLPEGSTKEDIANEVLKVTGALEARMDQVNDKVLAKTAANLRKQGIPEEEITRLCGEQNPYAE